MSEQEKFDDLVRSKFSERDFSFDEENWVKAEELITFTRQKEKRKRRAIIFLSGILVGLLVMTPFILKKDAHTTLAEKKEEKQAVAANSSENTTEEEEKQKSFKKETRNVANDNGNAEEKHPAAGTKEKTDLHQVKQQDNREATNNKTEPVMIPVAKNNTGTAGKNKGTGEKENLQEGTGTKKEPVVVAGKKTIPPDETNVSSNTREKNNLPPADENKKEAVNKNETPGKQITPMEPVKANKEKSHTIETKKSNGDTKIGAVSNTPGQTPVATTNNISAGTKDSTRKENLTTAESGENDHDLPIAIKKDSTSPVASVPPATKPDSVAKTISTWGASLDVGMNGFLSGGSGVSPFAGVNITKQLAHNWEIGSGIYYTYLPIYSGTSTFTISSTYDFGSTFKLTEIVTDKLHYITAPLFMKYNFKEDNSIIAGLDLYYLFNSSNIITTYELSYSGMQNKISKKTSGYFNGFSAYDVGIIAGYRKTLFKNFGVALYVNYGLINLQKPGAAHDINIHNNISGQLMLTYKLFK
jgi:hypothetical protein